MLKPEEYKNSVREFLSHFQIPLTGTDKFNDLCSIIKKFSLFPYENVTKIIKSFKGRDAGKLRLPEEIFQDHLKWNTGGTCFSLSFFLYCILEEAGINSYIVMGDRTYGDNTHCALVSVIGKEKFLVDPGFLVDSPLKFPVDNETQLVTPVNAFIFRKKFDYFNHFEFFTLKNEKKELRYILKDIPVCLSDFENHWMASFNFSMMHSIVITKFISGQKIYIRDRFLKKSAFLKDRNMRIKGDFAEELSLVSGISPYLLDEAKEYLNRYRRKKL